MSDDSKCWTDQYITAGQRHGAKLDGNAPGARPRNYAAPVGKGAPVFAKSLSGGQSRTETVDLVEYTVNEGPTIFKDASVDIYTSSPRLSATLTLFIERKGSIGDQVIAGPVACPATVHALGINPNTGSVYRLQGLHNFTPPFALQLATGYKAVRLVVTVGKGNWDFAAGFNGATMRLSVAWEPNVEISDEELQRLYAGCKIGSVTPVVV